MTKQAPDVCLILLASTIEMYKEQYGEYAY